MAFTRNTTAHLDDDRRDEYLTGLIKRCDQGHENALQELYDACSSQLFTVIIRILKIEGVAEEVLQDTFVKIWQKAGTYIPTAGSPMGWMVSIARHQSLDLLRRRSIREDKELLDGTSTVAATPDPSKSLQAMNEDAELLLRCLDQLTPNARECIVSAYCEGLSHEELSQRTGSPVNTIKSWIRRGLVSLRACINEHA
jgi:RNA polymerase sigma-70 factor (ECF subfamily)